MKDWWIWCGSVIRGEDGLYHMFASRWPKALSFSPHWLTNSEVVRAVSERPEGPYEFAEVVLAARGPEWWDGRMTHNPTIHRCGDVYLLFYTGTTYDGPTPEPGREASEEMRLQARANQRIGLAVSRSVYGPWQRMDEPILKPRPGKWDGLITTNPAAWVMEDGRVILVYKSVGHQRDLLRLGVAVAESYQGPYVRASDEPIFRFDDTGDHVEDPYVWYEDGVFQMVMKDMRGGICGEAGGGIHAWSEDGVSWKLAEPVKAWSRRVEFDDGSARELRHVERPQVLVEDGRARWVFFAVMSEDGRDTWNMAVPVVE